MEAVLVQEIARTYKRERHKLLDYIRGKVGSTEDAEDILQDVFVKALGGFSVINPIDNLVSWLYTITKNRIVDWYRKKRLKTVSLYQELENITLMELIRDEGIDIEKDLIRNIVMEAIGEALEELPAKQKEVFYLQVLEGKSFKELAEMTNTPINTLLARKRYAVLFLRQRLKEIRKMLTEEV
jgi:RNA polymerase sigma factor (sigma-70 family)